MARERFWILSAALFAFGVTAVAAGQDQQSAWQSEVRQLAEQEDWAAAMRIVEAQIARSPQDTDLLAWRARILTWSGRLPEAETQYLSILEVTQKDPDIWLGLGTVYLREGKTQEALRALDTALALDPKRSDLHAARARALRNVGKGKEARLEFQQALTLEPTSVEARSGLRSFTDDTKQELRVGEGNDLFNFISPNHDESVYLLSRWTSRWWTNIGMNTYQRAGREAGKFGGSMTARTPKWGSLTVGGAIGHDNAVIPKSEAFFDLDRGWNRSEGGLARRGLVRGLELIYGQHWYWYQDARILTMNESTIVYFPGEWTASLTVTGVCSAFSGTGAEWRPSGTARIGFPVGRWAEKRLSGSILYSAGTEDFGELDQIGRFASQTYGGALRFQFTPTQDITGYASFQNRTQNRTDTNFGFSYGIHF